MEKMFFLVYEIIKCKLGLNKENQFMFILTRSPTRIIIADDDFFFERFFGAYIEWLHFMVVYPS